MSTEATEVEFEQYTRGQSRGMCLAYWCRSDILFACMRLTCCICFWFGHYFSSQEYRRYAGAKVRILNEQVRPPPNVPIALCSDRPLSY